MADARVTDQNLIDSFQEGFKGTTTEVLDQSNWVVTVIFLYEGVALRTMTFPFDLVELGIALVAVTEHAESGPGAEAHLFVVLAESAELASDRRYWL